MSQKESWLALFAPLPPEGGGRHQETAGGRIDSDGRMHATYWLTEGERHTLRAPTTQEEEGLRRLAAALLERCKAS